MNIRVSILEDDTETRKFTTRLINQYPDLECVGSFDNPDDFMNAFDAIRPDVALVDIDLKQKMNGIDCIRVMKEKKPEVEYIIFTVTNDASRIFEALSVGATGYLLKDATPEEIAESIREIKRGGSPMTESIARLVVSSFRRYEDNIHYKQLSNREKEIVLKLRDGLIYKEIANDLNIDVETVRKHVYNIYKKLGVNNRTEALLKLFGK